MIGNIYWNGIGDVTRDLEKAIKYTKLAVEVAELGSEKQLGAIYEFSIRDHDEAMRWYRQGAERGDIFAQFELAEKYRIGRGVRNDFAEAKRWYQHAAIQGYPRAQVGLGFLYRDGRGVLQDYVRAHMWLNIATSADRTGGPDAQYARKTLEALMTPAQIAKAQELARLCLTSEYKNCD